MIHIVWEFYIRPDRREAFERYYSSAGQWAALFRKSSAYRETILTQDLEVPARYLLTDVWEDFPAFQDFKQRFQAEYEQLDKLCEPFTVEERCLGIFQIR